MDTYEATNLLEESLQCLARSMEQIRLRELEKVMGTDEPMQDHLAECTWAIRAHEGMEFEDCLKYLERLHQGFKTAAEHEDKAYDVARRYGNNFDIAHIADMVMGFIGHGFPQSLVDCAIEINAAAKRLFPKGKYVKSDKGCRTLIAAFSQEAEKLIKKHHFQTWEDGNYSLPMGYLCSWMRNKYWGK